jgi:hypothetical protein
MIFGEQDYIYFEGDDVGSIFFLTKGANSFVLPKHNNQKYVNVSEGNMFGLVDIIGSAYKHEKLEIHNWFMRKDLLKRQFSTIAFCYTEVMSLSI